MNENNEMNSNKVEDEIIEKKSKSKSYQGLFILIGVLVFFIIIVMLAIQENNSNCFYKGNLKRVQTEYITNSDNYKAFSENDLEDFIKVSMGSDLKENLNWDKIYPYYYKYAKENDVVFRNQGFYVNVEGQECLAIYLTSSDIYFNERVLKEAKNNDAIHVIQCFYDCMGESDIFNTPKDALYNILLDLDEKSVYLQNLLLLISCSISFDKPVIYLYPEIETDISITVEGVDLTTTYPQYNNGWSVTAYPDGTLVDKNNREYNYLYWEGKSIEFEANLSEGFVVSKDKYIEFLEDKLSYVGLTDKEACDFITYWLPQMNEFDYCLVSFQMKNYEEQVKLDFSVKPDNELRVFIAFKGLSDFVQIEEQDLSYYEDFERSGFTVVEWGGTFIE